MSGSSHLFAIAATAFADELSQHILNVLQPRFEAYDQKLEHIADGFERFLVAREHESQRGATGTEKILGAVEQKFQQISDGFEKILKANGKKLEALEGATRELNAQLTNASSGEGLSGDTTPVSTQFGARPATLQNRSHARAQMVTGSQSHQE